MSPLRRIFKYAAMGTAMLLPNAIAAPHIGKEAEVSDKSKSPALVQSLDAATDGVIVSAARIREIRLEKQTLSLEPPTAAVKAAQDELTREESTLQKSTKLSVEKIANTVALSSNVSEKDAIRIAEKLETSGVEFTLSAVRWPALGDNTAKVFEHLDECRDEQTQRARYGEGPQRATAITLCAIDNASDRQPVYWTLLALAGAGLASLTGAAFNASARQQAGKTRVQPPPAPPKPVAPPPSQEPVSKLPPKAKVPQNNRRGGPNVEL